MNDLIKSDSNYKCVYWQQFYKVSLSPWGDILYAVKCWTSLHPWTWTTEPSASLEWLIYILSLVFCTCVFLTWRRHIALWETNWLHSIFWHFIANKDCKKKNWQWRIITIIAALKTTRSRWSCEYPTHTFSVKLNSKSRVLSVHHTEWMTGLCWISSAAFPSAEGRAVPECGLDGVARCCPCWINLCGRKRLSPLCLPFTL